MTVSTYMRGFPESDGLSRVANSQIGKKDLPYNPLFVIIVKPLRSVLRWRP